MQSDEQILAKTTELLANLQEKCWKGYEKKGMKKMFGKMYPNCVKKSKKKKRKNEEVELYEEKVLLEIEEDEMRVLEDVLDDLDGHKLSLSNVFDQNLRKVINFPTINTSTELGQFVNLLQNELGYDVEWEKGLISAEKKFKDESIEADVARLQGKEWKADRVKKIQMKIGKFFKKIADSSRNLNKLHNKAIAWAQEEGLKHVTKPKQLTGQYLEDALDDKELKYLYSLESQLNWYLGPSKNWQSGTENIEKFEKLGKYWMDNAAYIKDNIKNLTNDKYSIIITRHPIDVLRMSDFKNITSCHSPASRTNAYQSYYKCAVAEAQGHGAVAYVVETEELLSATNTGNIQSAEQEIQEGEIFYDDKRYYVGDIKPVSRVRLRKMRYEEDSETGGEDLAVPEKRVYGAAIPGFVDRVVEWSRQSQQQQIENLPKKDGKFDLDQFTLYGGSYEDTQGYSGRKELLASLVNVPMDEFVGQVEQNAETENDLDADLIGDIRASYEEQCEQIALQWNNNYASTRVEFVVDDDGADGVYISAFGEIMLEWDADEFISLPNSYGNIVQYTSETINEYYGDLFRDNPYLGRLDGNIFWKCRVNMEHPDLGGQSYFALPEEFNEFCSKVDTIIDDRRDAFKEILSNYFRREEIMPGGKFTNLAMAIENGDISSYEWDVQTDGDYDDSYDSYASYSFDYDIEEVKMHEKVLMQILNSRDYKIQLRRNLLQQPQSVVDTDYFLTMEAFANKYVSGEVRVSVTFKINRDEPDEMVELFKDLVEGDMDDEDNLKAIFNKTLAQVRNFHGVWPEEEGPATSNINEALVNTWRRFIS